MGGIGNNLRYEIYDEGLTNEIKIQGPIVWLIYTLNVFRQFWYQMAGALAYSTDFRKLSNKFEDRCFVGP